MLCCQLVLRPLPALTAIVLLAGTSRAEPSARFPDAPATRPAASPQAAPEPRARAESWARAAARERMERGQALVRRGDPAAGLAELYEAVRLDPSFGEPLLAIAGLRERSGDPREAERVYTEALRLPEARARALAGRARTRRALGSTEEAFLDLEASVALEPTRQGLRELADWYIERRAWPAALVAWRRIQALAELGQAQDQREARVRVHALTLLAGESDPVSSEPGGHWVRASLAHIARRPP